MLRFIELLLVLYLMRLYLYAWCDYSFHAVTVQFKFFEQAFDLSSIKIPAPE